jgi:hypothetical protein
VTVGLTYSGLHFLIHCLLSLAIAANSTNANCHLAFVGTTRIPSRCTGVPMNLHAAEGTLPHVLVPEHSHFFDTVVLLIPSRPIRVLPDANVARLLRSDGGKTGNSKWRWQADCAECARVKIIVFL